MIEISKIIYAKRKSLAVSISENGEVIVKAPLGLSMSELQRFIAEKQSWIESKLKKVSSVQDRFKDIIEYRKLLVLGKSYYGYSSTNTSKITIQDDKILIPAKTPQEKLHKKIITWYKNLADSLLLERLQLISSQIKLKPISAKCTGSRGRWGACNNKKQLFLNWRCVMLPQPLIDYIIVHELAHLVELNHSPKFWAVVSQILPDYKSRRKKLKEYGFLLKLF